MLESCHLHCFLLWVVRVLLNKKCPAFQWGNTIPVTSRNRNSQPCHPGFPAFFWLPALSPSDSLIQKNSHFLGSKVVIALPLWAVPRWPFLCLLVSPLQSPLQPPLSCHAPGRLFHTPAVAPCLGTGSVSALQPTFQPSSFTWSFLLQVTTASCEMPTHLQVMGEPSPALLTVNLPWLTLQFREFNPVVLWWRFILNASIFWEEWPTFKLDRKRSGTKLLPHEKASFDKPRELGDEACSPEDLEELNSHNAPQFLK